MTTPTTTINPALELYGFWEPSDADGWLMSDWPAGQSSILQWSPDNVRVAADGSVELVLGRAPTGSEYPYQAGEVQSTETATTGTWGWTVQAPEMTPGVVFGLFTYKADWENQPWVEFDFEFVGADTTRVQLNIHMLNAAGEHVTLDDHGLKPVFINLGFDASKGVHTYEVTVTEEKAIFYIDGKVVGEFTGADMPGGVWNIGPMKSYINLWAVQPEQELWAGVWTDPAEPLVARITGAEVRLGEYGSSYGVDPDAPIATPTESADIDPDPTEEVADDGTVTVFSERSYILPDYVTNLVLTESADVNGTGNAFNNRLTGNAGNNVLDGGLGADTMEGGAGDDIYIVDNIGDRVVEEANGGRETVHASVSHILADYVENLTLIESEVLNGTGNTLDNRLTGNAAANTLAGAEGADILTGLAGNDTLYGNQDNDQLAGGEGSDRLHGGQGDDTLVGGMDDDHLSAGKGTDLIEGGEGMDTVEYLTSFDGIRVDLSITIPQVVSASEGSDTLVDIENLTGSRFNDTLTGNAVANTLVGAEGDDFLTGLAGSDNLQGGAGNDTLYGNQDDDLLIGGEGSDWFHGGQGNDTMVGGGGSDQLTGGLGADRFVFMSQTDSASRASAWDVIVDFSRDQNDKIDLSTIDANQPLSGDQAFNFIGIRGFSGSAGELRYHHDSGVTLIFADTNGDQLPDFSMELSGQITLLAQDFLL